MSRDEISTRIAIESIALAELHLLVLSTESENASAPYAESQCRQSQCFRIETINPEELEVASFNPRH